MTHSKDWYVDELPQHSEKWYDERYDHKYSGHEGLRELIRIIKLHLSELDSVLQEQLDNHEERVLEIEGRLANVVGSSEPVKLEEFVANTIDKLSDAESRLDALDDRFDNFATSSESSEALSIEDVIENIIETLIEVEEHLEDVDTVEVGSEILTVQEVVDLFLDMFDELSSEDESLSDRIEELSDRAIQSIEYNGEEYLPTSNIFVQPQPEDKEEECIEQEAVGGVILQLISNPNEHLQMKALLKNLKVKKELETVDINYNFGTLIRQHTHDLNESAFGYKVIIKRNDTENVIASASGLVTGTDASEFYDVTDWYLSDTLTVSGLTQLTREDEAYDVSIVWDVIPEANWEISDVDDNSISIVYNLTVPALGDDVLKDGVIIIPTDIDLSDATVRVGEGSEEERKTIKKAIDDLIADLEAEGSERSAEDEAIRGKLVELNEALGDESSERESEDVRIYNELINIINELSSESSSDIEEIRHRLDHWYESSEYEGEKLEDAIDDINYNIYELKQIIGSMEHLDYQVVAPEDWPVSEPKKGVIYLVGPVESSEDSAVAGSYVEYIYVNGEFEQIGTTEAQLSQYVRNSRLDDFNHSGASLEEGIDELVDQLSDYVTSLTTAINDEKSARQTKDAELESGKVSKSGDTMTGQLVVASGNTNGVKFTNTGAYPDVTVYANRGWHDSSYDDDYPRISFAGKNNSGKVLLGNVLEPKEGYDAANKNYVDSKISNVPAPTSDNNPANKKYVDDAIAGMTVDGVVDVAVNNEVLVKDSEGKVNIPLVSQVYDGVVPKYNGTPVGTLQDGDIVLVMRNNVPTWTEVDIYSLEPDVEPTLAISYARCGYPYSGGIMDDISLDPLAVQEETHAYYWINSGIRTDEPIQFEISVNTPVIDNLNIDPSLGDPSVELSGYNNWDFHNNITLDTERKVLVFWLSNGGNEMDSGNIDIVFHTEGGQELTVSIVVETRG